MEKRDFWVLGLFALVLGLFAVFTTKMHFHDSLEYLNLAKSLAGVQNINIFSAHSALYPFLMGGFLKLWRGAITIRLVNVFWVFVIGFVLLIWLKNKIAFILFAFSPLSWYMSIQTTPVLPAAFFFLISYIFLLKKRTKFNLILSGIFLGLSFAFYTPVILLAGFLTLIYFWNKSLLETIKYSIAFGIGFLPRLILDFYLFGNPLYSLIRFFGVNIIMSTSLHSDPTYGLVKIIPINTLLLLVFVFLFISPFLFRLHKLKFEKYGKVLIFIGIISLIFIVRVPFVKYFFLLSPLLLVLLSRVLSKKEIKWHCIISVILIVGSVFFNPAILYDSPVFDEGFLINDFFGGDTAYEKDLQQIQESYNVDYIVGGGVEAALFSVFSWEDKPYFVYYEDFEASLNNESLFREYVIGFDSNQMPLKDKFEISGSFSRYENIAYENYIIVASKGREIAGREVVECYEVLCTYE